MFRYKLRTLLIAVTLAGLFIGGRVEYLRPQATFHANAATRASDYGEYLYHHEFAQNYSDAVVRPWSMVKSPPPEVRGDK